MDRSPDPPRRETLAEAVKVEIEIEGADLEAFREACVHARRRRGAQSVTHAEVLIEGLYSLIGRASCPWREAVNRHREGR
jgi:hypothetical protein